MSDISTTTGSILWKLYFEMEKVTSNRIIDNLVAIMTLLYQLRAPFLFLYLPNASGEKEIWHILQEKMGLQISRPTKNSKVHWIDTWHVLCYLISQLKLAAIQAQKSGKMNRISIEGNEHLQPKNDQYFVLPAIGVTTCSLMPDCPGPICARWCRTII